MNFKNEREIAESAVETAIDQQDMYESLTKAFESYEENAIDTAREYGFDLSDTSDWFYTVAEQLGYSKEVHAIGS